MRPEMLYLASDGTRLWASFRAQTLARTVESIMQSQAAHDSSQGWRESMMLEEVKEAAPKPSRLCSL